VGITSSEAGAAYLASVFWAGLTLGRLLSILSAMVCSATSLLRAHLLASLLCAFLFLYTTQGQGQGLEEGVDGGVGGVDGGGGVGGASEGLGLAAGVSGLMGLSLSAIYALVMTLVMDYGFTM
jgi:hypothetical protein